jgi:hypothetical protein
LGDFLLKPTQLLHFPSIFLVFPSISYQFLKKTTNSSQMDAYLPRACVL